MNLSTQLLIHVSVEIIAVAIILYYFQKKINKLNDDIRDIQKHMLNQQNIINRHEKILSDMIGIYPQTTNINFHETNPEVFQPTPPQQPQPVVPMMENIFNMLNSVASIATPNEPPQQANPIEQKEKIDVESELKQELEELNEARKDEGRIDEEENNDLKT